MAAQKRWSISKDFSVACTYHVITITTRKLVPASNTMNQVVYLTNSTVAPNDQVCVTLKLCLLFENGILHLKISAEYAVIPHPYCKE